MRKFKITKTMVANNKEYTETRSGTWAGNLEISIATLVDFRINKTEGTAIRVNIHVLQKHRDGIEEATFRDGSHNDVVIDSNERSFSQSFIQKDNQEGIIIYNNG